MPSIEGGVVRRVWLVGATLVWRDPVTHELLEATPDQSIRAQLAAALRRGRG